MNELVVYMSTALHALTLVVYMSTALHALTLVVYVVFLCSTTSIWFYFPQHRPFQSHHNNNNNNKTCNTHVSTLLGVQGAVKPTTNKTKQKQNKEKQTQQKLVLENL